LTIDLRPFKQCIHKKTKGILRDSKIKRIIKPTIDPLKKEVLLKSHL